MTQIIVFECTVIQTQRDVIPPKWLYLCSHFIICQLHREAKHLTKRKPQSCEVGVEGCASHELV